MATQAQTIYSADQLRPVLDTEDAHLMSVRLPAGVTYAAGTVLAEIAGTGSNVNEVQTLTISGSPTGGTYRILYNGEITAPIAHNANAAAIQAALEALPSIGTGGVTVTGTGPFTITFVGLLGALEQPLLLTISALTGGTTPAATIASTTKGKPANGHHAAYNDAVSDRNVARMLLKYPCSVNSQGMIAFTGGEHGTADATAPAYYAGNFRTVDLVGIDANGVADLGRLIRGTTSTLTNANTILRIA